MSPPTRGDGPSPQAADPGLRKLRGLPPTMGTVPGLIATVIAHLGVSAAAVGLPLLLSQGPVAIVLAVLAGLLVATAGNPVLHGSDIRVGQDGVSIRWMGFTRFVSFASVKDVRASGPAVELVMDDGRVERIATGVSARGGDVRSRLLAELKRALAAFRARPEPETADLVSRGGRSNADWLKDLDKLAQGDYRHPALNDDALWALIENPRTEPSARAGALRALRAGSTTEGRERVRVATEGVAAPKVRVALEAAASDDDKALEEALVEIGKDEGRSARPGDRAREGS